LQGPLGSKRAQYTHRERIRKGSQAADKHCFAMSPPYLVNVGPAVQERGAVDGQGAILRGTGCRG
jgi:hypothetical protein